MRTDRPFLMPATALDQPDAPLCLDCHVELTSDDKADERCNDCHDVHAEEKARRASGRSLLAAVIEPLRPWRKRLPGFDDEGPGAA